MPTVKSADLIIDRNNKVNPLTVRRLLQEILPCQLGHADRIIFLPLGITAKAGTRKSLIADQGIDARMLARRII